MFDSFAGILRSLAEDSLLKDCRADDVLRDDSLSEDSFAGRLGSVTDSLRKMAGSPLRGSAMRTSSARFGNSATGADTLPRASGVGSWALAIAAARGPSPLARRSCIRRSTLVPHMPQNFRPASFTWSQDEHFKLMPLVLARRSVCRRSSRTPHMPQNLCSWWFSVPQKVQSMRYLTPLAPLSGTLLLKTAAPLCIRMMLAAE
jgi:hypothetical protein